MSNYNGDHWVAMAMEDDALVADQILRIRHHQPAILPQWVVRQRRTPRLVVHRAHTARASPTTPLTWTAATSVDGYEGSTRPAAPAPSHASRSKAVDQSETAAAKRSKKKRELAAMNLSFEKQSASNKSLKRIKLNLMSRETLKAGEAVLDPPETVEASNLASAQTFKDVCAAATASASLNQQEISVQEPLFLLPDLNLPVEEDFCDIRGLS
ncbi:hypothetical protein CR513_14078, partial [Mucuna pruriens]